MSKAGAGPGPKQEGLTYSLLEKGRKEGGMLVSGPLSLPRELSRFGAIKS